LKRGENFRGVIASASFKIKKAREESNGHFPQLGIPQTRGWVPSNQVGRRDFSERGGGKWEGGGGSGRVFEAEIGDEKRKKNKKIGALP